MLDDETVFSGNKKRLQNCDNAGAINSGCNFAVQFRFELLSNYVCGGLTLELDFNPISKPF